MLVPSRRRPVGRALGGDFVELPPKDQIHLRLGLRCADAWTQTAENAKPPCSVLAQIRVIDRLDRPPEFRPTSDLITEKSGRHNANDGQSCFADRDPPPYHIRVSAESAPPILVANDRRRLRAGGVVIGFGQRPPQQRIDAEHGKEIAGDALLLHRLRDRSRLTHSQPRAPYKASRNDARERLITVTEHFVQRVVEAVVCAWRHVRPGNGKYH